MVNKRSPIVKEYSPGPGVVFFKLDYEEALRRLRLFARDELGARPEVRDVILIGSLAKGNWAAFSDADLVLTVARASERGPLRGAQYRPREPLGIDVDILVFTPSERDEWSERFRDEVAKGIVLYRRDEPSSGDEAGQEA
jgi:predicted nucleotidyltransferase